MGFLDNLLSGSKKDTSGPLFPRNRKEVFFDLFHNRKMALVEINLLCVLFALPSILLIFLVFLYKGNIDALIASGDIILVDPLNVELSKNIILFQTNNALFAILIPLNLVASLGLAGGFYVMQRLVYAENISVWHDFFVGLKRNAREYSLLALVISLSLFFLSFVTGYYKMAEMPLAVEIISYAVAVLQFVIVLGTCLFAFPQANLYQMKFGMLLKNSFRLFISSVFKSIGVLMMTLAPLGLLYVPVPMFQSVVSVVLILFMFSFVILIWVLFANRYFDKYLNPHAHEEIIDKGMKKSL